MMKYISPVVAIAIFTTGCEETPLVTKNVNTELAQNSTQCVSLLTNKGEIILGLDGDKAPESVANFIGYTNAQFYDGLIFHRVINNFMIQGGGFNSLLEKQSTNAAIINEADNGLSNTRGSIAMARTSDPHSATSQFFINSVDNTFLDHTSKTTSGWGYAVFGQVMSGMGVVDTISKVATGAAAPFSKDVPTEPVIITRSEVIACDTTN